MEYLRPTPRLPLLVSSFHSYVGLRVWWVVLCIEFVGSDASGLKVAHWFSKLAGTQPLWIFLCLLVMAGEAASRDQGSILSVVRGSLRLSLWLCVSSHLSTTRAKMAMDI